MKKIICVLLILLVIVTGCGSVTKESLVEKFEDKVSSSKSYKVNGKMEILNGEDEYVYNLEASFLKDDYYKVVLINETNNHEQVILKNPSGVFVVTPSLNKSFKFDSVWPDNSSQGYFLSSLVKDVTSDDKVEMLEDEENYIIKSSVNYPNNKNLSYQKIYFDDDMLPTMVEVYDTNDNVSIKVTFTKIDLNAGLKDSDFVLEDYIDKDVCEDECGEDETCKTTCETTMASNTLDNILYPVYMPENTYMTSTEEINNETVNRAILTFAGDKNFVLIEEASRYSDEFETIPITGNPVIINDTVAAMSSNSIYFTKNNVDYYLVSNDLTNDEMVSIASSITNDTAVSYTK